MIACGEELSAHVKAGETHEASFGDDLRSEEWARKVPEEVGGGWLQILAHTGFLIVSKSAYPYARPTFSCLLDLRQGRVRG